MYHRHIIDEIRLQTVLDKLSRLVPDRPVSRSSDLVIIQFFGHLVNHYGIVKEQYRYVNFEMGIFQLHNSAAVLKCDKQATKS